MIANLAPEIAEALDVARQLAAAGIPVFVAAPDPSKKLGFALPSGWQQTVPDPTVIYRWRPGMALCAVMGHGFDLIDVDPRGGGDLTELSTALEGLPRVYGTAVTPSGGVHAFVRSLGVGSRDGVLPGIDVKAGDPDGQGRGFAFLAPTVRPSKVTGELVAYRWITPPDLLAGLTHVDDTGAALRELVLAARSKDHSGDSVAEFMRVGPWADIPAALAGGRNNGVAKLAASLRGRGGLLLEDALDVMYRRVWPLIDQGQSGHEFSAEEFEQTIRAAWRQYPDGEEQRAAEAAVPPVAPDGSLQPPSPARYFGQGGLLAQTLAGDAALLGPLAEGVDDRMWRYDQAGVWRPDKDVVRDRSAWLMGDRYRGSHARTAEDVVRALYSAKIRCDPIADVINFRNGLLRWRTGELRPHTPDVLTTVQLGVAWNPDAECPAFERFLADVLPPDMIVTVWELIGYLMYSGNPLHKAVMLTGTGRNGKGTLLRVVTALLDVRNITSVSLHDLVNTRFSTASLFGKLANIAGDIDGSYLENTATFKGITGGDTISAEHKGRDRFDFTPWAVPVFSANKIPASADTTVGYLSRWLVVPFPNDFTGREDRTLDLRLRTEAELQGIAAKAVRALPALLDRGDFVLTESARAAREEFVQRVDQVRAWIDEAAEIGGPSEDEVWPFVPRTQLYAAYQGWAQRDGHRAVRASEFYDRIEAAGAWPYTVHGTRGFKRIRLRIDGGTGPVGWVQVPTEVRPAPAVDTTELQSVTEILGPPAPSKTAGQTPNDQGSGAQGAVHPHPPSRARTQEKVRTDSHPQHPRSTSTPASDAKAEAKAEAIRVAVETSAGPRHPLPAAVNRGGVVQALTIDEARLVLDALAAGPLTVDVETTGYPTGHEHFALRTVQLGTADLALVLDPDEHKHLIFEALCRAPRLHAHSATADLVPLARLIGREGSGDYPPEDLYELWWRTMHDTVIPAKLADPSSTGSDPALKQLARALLAGEAVSPAADEARAAVFKAGRWLTEVKPNTAPERSGWAQIPRDSEAMLRYAASDVLDTALLAQRLPALPEVLLDRERAVESVTARVTLTGLPLDREHVDRLHGEWTDKKREAGRVLAERWDVANGASSVQVATRAAELGIEMPATKAGKPSVAKGVLEPYANGFAGSLEQQAYAADVLANRTAVNRLGLFLDHYRETTRRGDGRVRPTIYTLAADTGRMSCVRPNLQQVPREGGFRACVTADEDWRLVSADFAGVELRVAAALSGDGYLLSIITDPNATSANKADLHWLVTKQVFGPEATKAHRYAVKRGVFGWLYGGGAQTLAEHMGATVPIAQAMIDTLTQMFPTLVVWTQQVRNAVKAGLRSFTAYNGRVIHLTPDTPHKAPNYCIQGTARELLVEAILRWDDAARQSVGTPIVLPVHDEIVTMAPAEDAQRATDLLVHCMTSELHGVPIKAEPSEPAFAWQDSV